MHTLQAFVALGLVHSTLCSSITSFFSTTCCAYISTKCCSVASVDQSDGTFPATDDSTIWQPRTGMSTILETDPLSAGIQDNADECKHLCELVGGCNVITFDTEDKSCKLYESLDSMIESPNKTAKTFYIDGSVDTHYGDPRGGCLAEEMQYSIANIPDAYFCSAECGDDGWCPEDGPSEVEYPGECLLNDPVGTSHHCAIPCEKDSDCGREMKCNLEYDQGICAYSIYSYNLERPLPEFTNQDIKYLREIENTPTV